VGCALTPSSLTRPRECPPCACGHLAQGLLALALGITGGSLGAYLVFAFPPKVRYTCLALGYNVALALFGGSAALIATALFELSGGPVTSARPYPPLSSCALLNAPTHMLEASTRKCVLSSVHVQCDDAQRNLRFPLRRIRVLFPIVLLALDYSPPFLRPPRRKHRYRCLFERPRPHICLYSPLVQTFLRGRRRSVLISPLVFLSLQKRGRR